MRASCLGHVGEPLGQEVVGRKLAAHRPLHEAEGKAGKFSICAHRGSIAGLPRSRLYGTGSPGASKWLTVRGVDQRVSSSSARLPSGVVTFLLTDIEGSTARWEAEPEQMTAALVRHDEVVREAIEACGGTLVKSKGEGDSTFSLREARPCRPRSRRGAARARSRPRDVARGSDRLRTQQRSHVATGERRTAPGCDGEASPPGHHGGDAHDRRSTR